MLHGIEELRKRGDGTVLWREIAVEHYSYGEDVEGEAKAAHGLAARCRHLEALGVHVTACWDWFETMTTETPVEYRRFLEGAGSFYEHSDERLCWVFSYEKLTKGADEDTEIVAIYFWNGSSMERVEHTVNAWGRPGLYHVLTGLGWRLADAGQAGHLGPCCASWAGMWRLLARHGLTPEALAASVLPSMPAPPAPPKPVSTLAEARRALTREVVRGFKEGDGSLPEADDDINDASRAVVRFMYQETGAAWLGEINPSDNHRPTVVWPWDGEALIHNFGASFVMPKPDAVLERLIFERNHAPYTGTREDSKRVEAIMARLEEVGGIHLTWT